MFNDLSNRVASRTRTAYKEPRGKTSSCNSQWSKPSQDLIRSSDYQRSWHGTVRTWSLERIKLKIDKNLLISRTLFLLSE